MITYLTLDLSKRRAGFTLWNESMEKPVMAHWALGNELTDEGTVFLRLHQCLNDLYMVSPFQDVLYEEPLNLGPGSGETTRDTIFLLIGLAAHVDSFCAAKRIKCRSANMSSWRGFFLGSIPRGPRKDSQGNKIRQKPIDFKDLAMQRAREFGMNPRCHDEAESFGVMDYRLNLAAITSPWRIAVPLVRQFGVRGK